MKKGKICIVCWRLEWQSCRDEAETIIGIKSFFFCDLRTTLSSLGYLVQHFLPNYISWCPIKYVHSVMWYKRKLLRIVQIKANPIKLIKNWTA